MIRILKFLLLIIPFQLFADPYPKNPDIDILHYRFKLELSDKVDIIKGTATITAKFKRLHIDQLRLDLTNIDDNGKGMQVDSIISDNRSMAFVHENDVIIVKLTTPTKVGDELSVTIFYHGIPATGLKIAPNKYGDRVFFSDNWPNKARNWLPTVDHPSDKATSEMIIEAPNQYQVVSNGLLIEETNLANSRKRTHWRQGVPISPWLYVLGVAEFAVQYVDTFNGKSIQTWVYKQDRDAGFYDFAIPTKRTLQFFTDYIGPFQYEKLANIQSNSVGGGMEAASAILYGENSVSGNRSTRWRNVIIHELAHQWFGNAVTESSWDDVWLSEGFATYFTLLFREHAYGREDFVMGLQQSRNRVYDFYKTHKSYTIVHDDLQDMGKVTTGQTYQKGAWILHMLRNLVGDEKFQQGIRNYYAKYVNATATTQDFQREIEMVSDQDLEWFFRQWLNGGGHIVLDGNWKYDDKDKKLEISLTQIQNDGYEFQFPIEFGIYGEGDITPQIIKKNFDASSKIFTITVEGKPEKIVLDPRTVLLAEWTLSEK
jgi:aminopeptidase N